MARATLPGNSIEVAVGALSQLPHRLGAVGSGKGVKHREIAVPGNPVNRPARSLRRSFRGSEEIALLALNWGLRRVFAVRSACELMQGGDASVLRHLEDRPKLGASAAQSDAVIVSVSGQDETASRLAL